MTCPPPAIDIIGLFLGFWSLPTSRPTDRQTDRQTERIQVFSLDFLFSLFEIGSGAYPLGAGVGRAGGSETLARNRGIVIIPGFQ